MFLEFNFVEIGGRCFIMSHPLALLPLPLVDGKFRSENRKLSRPKISLGVWAENIRVFPGNRPKKVPKMAQIPQNCLIYKKNHILCDCKQKTAIKMVCRGGPRPNNLRCF